MALEVILEVDLNSEVQMSLVPLLTTKRLQSPGDEGGERRVGGRRGRRGEGEEGRKREEKRKGEKRATYMIIKKFSYMYQCIS